MIFYIISAIISYLIGSVSVSLLICKLMYHKDLRESGSGNAGATNAARVFGPVAGVLTFLGDFAKCVLAMYLSKLLGGETAMLIGGIACMLGHCFPIFFHFKGGKAVSTAGAAAMMVDWRIFVIAFVFFFLLAFLTRRVSLASILSGIAIAVMMFAFQVSLAGKILGCFLCVLVLFMHRENIKRLLNGTEAAFTFGKSKSQK